MMFAAGRWSRAAAERGRAGRAGEGRGGAEGGGAGRGGAVPRSSGSTNSAVCRDSQPGPRRPAFWRVASVDNFPPTRRLGQGGRGRGTA